MEQHLDNNSSSKSLLNRGFGALSFLTNKYLLTAVAFLIWMLFFDKNDFLLQAERANRNKQLTKNEASQTQQITETRKELSALKTSALTIEKYARENYMMKKDNEDLFIITSSKENK